MRQCHQMFLMLLQHLRALPHIHLQIRRSLLDLGFGPQAKNTTTVNLIITLPSPSPITIYTTIPASIAGSWFEAGKAPAAASILLKVAASSKDTAT